MTETMTARLHTMARAAAAAAKGNAEKAVERLDKLLRDEDSAALERELCKQWRLLALKAQIATAFNELRAEGRIAPRPVDVPIRTSPISDLGVSPHRAHEPVWARPSKKRYDLLTEVVRKSVLDLICVNGLPLRTTPVADAWAWATKHEMEGRFVRELLRGMPHVGTVGQYAKDAEADALYKKISAEINANAA